MGIYVLENDVDEKLQVENDKMRSDADDDSFQAAFDQPMRGIVDDTFKGLPAQVTKVSIEANRCNAIEWTYSLPLFSRVLRDSTPR